MPKKILVLLLLGVSVAACSISPETQTTPSPEAQALAGTPTPEPADTPTPIFSSNPFNDGMIARRNGDYTRAAAAFQFVLNSNPVPDPSAGSGQALQHEARFRFAETLWLKKDYARAIDALNVYLQSYATGTHAPEVRYFLADAYRAQKDYSNALAQLRLYREQSSMLVGDTDATIADVMVATGDAANAIAQYDRALQDPLLANGNRILILQRAADAHTVLAQPAQAAARYDAAIALAQDARTRADLLLRAGESYVVANQLDVAMGRWRTIISDNPDQPAAYKVLVNLVNRGASVDEFQRGLVNYHAASYDAAIGAFERYLDKEGTRVGDAHYFIGSSYARKGSPSQAIAEYDKIIKSLPKDKRIADAYLGKAGALATLGKVDDAVTAYKRFAAVYPQDLLADDALWRAAQLLDRLKRYNDASDVYEQLQAKYPARERAAEALFWAGLDDYRGRDYKAASTKWQLLVKEYTQSPFFDRALFWLGKAAKARGENDAAKKYWTQASGSASRNYYAWRAGEMLNSTKNNSDARRYDPARYAMDNPADRAAFEKWLSAWTKSESFALDGATRDDLRFKRGVELLRLDRTVEARAELAALIIAKKDDPRALYALALYFRDNNLFSLSIDCANRIARAATAAGVNDTPRFLWMLRYPTYYADLVVAEAKANSVDPLLYFALIKQESDFNPWATSWVDARGLGQVMPATGREIAGKLRVRDFSLDQLYLPYVSIRFGVWYFAQDLKTFDEPIYALAAYNAGTKRVTNWQRPDLDLAVEEIDLSETNLYVRIVMANWRQYQEVYK